MLVFSFLIVLSLKRSSLLVMLLYWAVYGMTLLKSSRNRIWAVVVIVVMVGVGMYAYTIADEALGGALNERVNREETDEGRNRLGIYKLTLNMITSSPPHKILIGHGHFGVRLDSPLGISAHNDFLEVIYDYGLFAFVLYLCLWGFVIRRCIYLYKEESEYFYPYAVSLSIFLVMSLVSHLILYNSYFIYIVMFWGALEGYMEYQAELEEVDEEQVEPLEIVE